MRFAYLTTIATLVIGTTAFFNADLCGIMEVSKLKNITNLYYKAYKEETQYLKVYSNSSVASSVAVYNRIQTLYLQQLCREIQSKANRCMLISKSIFMGNSSCNEIAKLSLIPSTAAKR